jgi:ribose/xylose/arabinose/galactoside ABC-type transport system permease subunit
MLSFFVAAHLFTRYTQLGRDLYAVGGNRDAAQASGIDTGKRIRQIYIISGLIAAFSGWMFIGRLGSAVASMGQGMIFEIQAAAVIGGQPFGASSMISPAASAFRLDWVRFDSVSLSD